MLIRIWAFLTGRRLVWLRDFDGEITLSLERIDAFGFKTAYRYPLTHIHLITLLSDGSINQRDSYVKEWKYYKELS